MNLFEQSLFEMNHIFGRDIQYALATVDQGNPFVRIVDGFFLDGSIYITSYGLARKVKHISQNPNVSLCYQLNSFAGTCENIGHPDQVSNKTIRETLKKVFYLFYDKHVDEKDPNTCILKVKLSCAVMFTQNKKYEFDFDQCSMKVSNFIDDMIYLP